MSKLEELQKDRPVVHCGEKVLENLFRFLYLDIIFAANCLQCYGVAARVTMSMSRCDKLRHVFDSPHISLKVSLSCDCMRRQFAPYSHMDVRPGILMWSQRAKLMVLTV